MCYRTPLKSILLLSLLWIGVAKADPLCRPGDPRSYDDCCYESDPRLKQYCPSTRPEPAPANKPRQRNLTNDRFDVDETCKIPEKYRDSIAQAWEQAAKRIVGNAKCRDAYAAVLFKDSGAQVLEKLQIEKFALADQCKPLLDKLQKAHNSRTLGEAAYSSTGGDTIYFAESTLKAGPGKIACSIMHETAHLAGADANLLFEPSMNKIHTDCNCPR